MNNLQKHLQDNYSHNELADLANHGAEGGFGNFIYYSDNIEHFNKFKDECFEAVNAYNNETGEEGLPKYIVDNSSDYQSFCNSMIWFAIECCARELTNGDYIQEKAA